LNDGMKVVIFYGIAPAVLTRPKFGIIAAFRSS
jgi:hypothetical protein